MENPFFYGFPLFGKVFYCTVPIQIEKKVLLQHSVAKLLMNSHVARIIYSKAPCTVIPILSNQGHIHGRSLRAEEYNKSEVF